jgi:Cu(I)/Ag(I) efflux system protein CusF
MTSSREKKAMMIHRTRTALVLAALLFAAPAAAQSLVDGQVTKVDASAGKITIRHGPLKQFDMEDGMTMVFRAGDPAMLKAVKAGDKVRFIPERINGQFTVTRIEKAK